MAFFGVEITNSSKNQELVKEFNKTINSTNPVFVLFQGKASLVKKWKKSFIVFNVRVNPFELPFYKYFFYLVFKLSIKKKKFSLKTKIMSSSEFQKLMRCFV